MDVSAVACNQCGASLEVGETTRFVTCRHCGSQLQVNRTESSLSTEVLNRIDQRTEEMAENLEAIRRGQELEQVEREWEAKQKSAMVRSKDGSESEPSIVGGVVMIVFTAGGGLMFFALASSGVGDAQRMGGPGVLSVFPCFGLLFAAVGVIGGISMIMKAQRYAADREEYQRRRAELERRGRSGME